MSANQYTNEQQKNKLEIENIHLSHVFCIAFTQMGFNFSPNFTKQLTGRSQDHKEVTVDEFIVLCVTVQRLTEAFRVRDTQQNGVITINFEDFLTVVLTNTN